MGRGVNHPGNWFAVIYQADIDREILPFGNEIARAVKRVEQIKQPVKPVRHGLRGKLFTDNLNIRRQLCQPVGNQFFAVAVGLGDNRLSALVSEATPFLKCVIISAPRLLGEGTQYVHELAVMRVERKWRVRHGPAYHAERGLTKLSGQTRRQHLKMHRRQGRFSGKLMGADPIAAPPYGFNHRMAFARFFEFFSHFANESHQ